MDNENKALVTQADDIEKLTQDSTYQFIDKMLVEIFQKSIDVKIGLPDVAAHLVVRKFGYTHHGLYCGLDESNEPYVIHYSGLADGLQAGPVETISLHDFCSGGSVYMQPHSDRKYAREESVRRAKTRLGEHEYNLHSNNCEHFVNWCISGHHFSDQVTGVGKVGARIALKLASKSNVLTNVANEVVHLGKTLKDWVDGEITDAKLLTEIKHAAVTSASMFWYGALGQAAIPIPVVGFLVGSAVGYFVGHTLVKSGHVAIGETPAVREARERQERIRAMCERLIPEIQANRAKLEAYLDTHFANRAQVFKSSFDTLDQSILSDEPEAFVGALHAINEQFGQALQFRNFEEFDELMESDEPFRF